MHKLLVKNFQKSMGVTCWKKTLLAFGKKSTQILVIPSFWLQSPSIKLSYTKAYVSFEEKGASFCSKIPKTSVSPYYG
jgi:hypothetical protein